MTPLMEIGDLGEKIASRYLEEKFLYQTIKFNYKIHKIGEIDIIAVDKRSVVAIEVKTRKSSYLFDPVLSVNDKKVEKIYKTLSIFLEREGKIYESFDIRLEIITIVLDFDNKVIDIKKYDVS